ncbi:MAG: efflux RND transporter periplasmic adaptor subunit, partial [Flammeovirgaceae bacterium]|nr:efflux RND transporter periplasmic adaptor subunit [Flammeovirgaceae bacterium]MDW8287931.1 efflux RND transporter periplasmic adaptor subunit [Flammeovirgaceae bacterium]
MKKFFIIVFVISIIGMSAFLGYYFYQKNQKDPIIYKTETPVRTTIIRKAVATGSIIPRREIEVKPQVSGILEKVFVEPGAKVKRGDLLARIKVIPDMTSVSNAESSLRRAQINLENAKKELDRLKSLFDQGVIAEQAYLQQKLTYDLAKESVVNAEENLRILKEGASKNAEIITTLVRATVDGMILDTPFKEGSTVIQANNFNAGSTIAIIADMSDMIFQGKVDESEVGKLKKGMKLNLTVGAIDSLKFEAELNYIAPKGVVEEGTMKFEVKANVKLNPGIFLRAGYSANADIVLEQKDSVWAIKESNLIFSE